MSLCRQDILVQSETIIWSYRMSKLQFKVIKQRGNARVWELTLNGVTLTTPIFMPVWTRATIKGLFLDVLQNPAYLWDLEPIKLILANTFHCYLRPWDALIKKAGGLHTFENRGSLILTDSGGFQVFSLGLNKDNDSPLRDNQSHSVNMKLKEEWVHFRSPHDGSKHFFSPENVVDIQSNFWSDIMMMLDVCSPWDADKETVAKQMRMTHRRAKRAYEYFMPKYDETRGVLFPIVQGWSHLDLRQRSIDALTPFATDGIAVWWVSVGEDKDKVQEVVAFVGPKLPADKPHYLMGVGMPEDLLFAIEQGFDMFDCVMATRLGRHGVMFTAEWNKHLKTAQFRDDFSPLCDFSPELGKYTKAYVHHLIKEGEMLGWIILSLHNILYLHKMLEDWKKDMLQ